MSTYVSIERVIIQFRLGCLHLADQMIRNVAELAMAGDKNDDCAMEIHGEHIWDIVRQAIDTAIKDQQDRWMR